MNEQDTALVACYARFRPQGSVAVHLAAPGADRTLCGRYRGGRTPDHGRVPLEYWVSCEACLSRRNGTRKHKPTEAPQEDQAAIARAEEALTGPPLVYLVALSLGYTAVYMPFNPLLQTVIRTIPGARWDSVERRWFFPSIFTAEFAQRMASAGVPITAQYATDRLCLRCAAELEDPEP
jgi:hypothetical protein